MRRAAQAENTGSGEGGAARKRNGAPGVDARGGTPNVEVVTIDDDGPADVRASVEGVVESPPELPPRPSSLSGLEGSAGARLSVSGTRKGSAFLCSRASSLSAEGRAREAVGERSEESQDSQASKPSKAALKAKLRRPAERCDCSVPGVQVFRGRFDRRRIEDKREEGQGRHAADELRDQVLPTCKCASWCVCVCTNVLVSVHKNRARARTHTHTHTGAARAACSASSAARLVDDGLCGHTRCASVFAPHGSRVD